MNFPARPLAALAAVALAGAGLSHAAPTNGPAPAPIPATGTLSVARARMVGSTGCAAQSCHGADVPKGRVGGEHHTWAAFDPHRNAFGVLHQERSRRMVRLLAEGDGTQPAPAHQTELCLRCHGAAAANLASALPGTSDLHANGSCENCHGAGEKYNSTHYLPGFQALTAAQKAEQYGLLPTKNLAERAAVCAGCHVGEPGREVDHRLIAAGHPALRWELAAGHAEPVYTKHWVEKGYGRDIEAWLWRIGQTANAKASAELLAHRAEQASTTVATRSKRDWPELAEYACFSCHQDLVPAAFRPATTARLGSLPWGTWHYPLARELPGFDRVGPASEADSLAELSDLFARSDRPDPAAAAASARAAAASLGARLAELQAGAERSATRPMTAGQIRPALGHVLTFAGRLPVDGAAGADWDRATQSILGAAALYRALVAVDPAARDLRAEALFRELAAGLRFEPGRDSPGRPAPGERAKMRSTWAELQARLGTGGTP